MISLTFIRPNPINLIYPNYLINPINLLNLLPNPINLPNPLNPINFINPIYRLNPINPFNLINRLDLINPPNPLLTPQIPRNHQPLYFRGSFADLQQALVAVKTFNRVIFHQPVTSVYLHGLVGNFLCNFRTI